MNFRLRADVRLKTLLGMPAVEQGDMKLDSQDGPQLASYARYNVLLKKEGLSSELGIELALEKIEQISGMDNPANMDELAKLGESAAKRQVNAEHLLAAFDLA